MRTHGLLYVDPFGVDGELNVDFVLIKSGDSPEGVEVFKKVIPGWFAYLDKGGAYPMFLG